MEQMPFPTDWHFYYRTPIEKCWITIRNSILGCMGARVSRQRFSIQLHLRFNILHGGSFCAWTTFSMQILRSVSKNFKVRFLSFSVTDRQIKNLDVQNWSNHDLIYILIIIYWVVWKVFPFIYWKIFILYK